MEIILNDEYKVLISGKNLGYIGEMNSRTITFENYLCEGADRYIMRLVYPDDVAYDVDISSGKYTVEASLLRDFKYCNAQILAVKSSGDNYIYVKKSNIFAFMISKSLDSNGVVPIPTYEMAKSELEKVLDVEVKADNVIKNLNATGLLARVQTSTGAYRDTATTPKAGDTIYLRFVSCSSSSVKNLIAYGRTTDDTAFEPIGMIDNADLPSQLYKFKLEKDYKYIQIGINPFNNTVSFEADYLLSDGSGVLPAIDDIQDKQVTIENQTCRIFRKVVCVGDSFTAGHIQTGDTQYTRNEMYAYPHYMELITGNEWVNCGASGTTVLTWQTHQNGLAKAQKSGVAQAYVIGLGLNDSRNSAVPVGTADDIGTDNGTYYGGLSKIVRELNAISPKAKIFINTCPKDDAERFDPYNEAVRTIATTYHDTYNTYCIDLALVKDKYKIPSITGDTINGHQTAVGYQQFATIYNQVLSDFINDNISEFQDVYLLQADTFDERAQIVQNKADITDLKSNKVDKIDGKGLSTNDYTDTEKAYVANISYNNAGSHNAINRGKNLGTSVTSAQYAAISDGTFKDLYIGDYWAINGITYRIAAFDYYLNTGDTACTKHHIVIVPDTALYYAVVNDTNTTVGGYVGSKMYTEGLERAKTTIKSAFDGHVLSHRIYLVNAVTDGHPSAGAWCDSEVDLMNEQMVYGGAIFMPIANGSAVYTNYRVEKSQLPLFAHDPSRICNRATWWLRDVVSVSHFATADYYGLASCTAASGSCGVRPAFCIC